MVIQKEKPVFKYNSFADYLADIRLKNPYIHRRTFDKYTGKMDGVEKIALKYPCSECSGNGRIVDPSEIPDVIEGHKLSRRISCPLCEGTGEHPLKEAFYQEHYDNMRQKYETELAEWNRLHNIWKTFRITDDEWEALEVFGRPDRD